MQGIDLCQSVLSIRMIATAIQKPACHQPRQSEILSVAVK